MKGGESEKAGIIRDWIVEQVHRSSRPLWWRRAWNLALRAARKGGRNYPEIPESSKAEARRQ